MTNKEKCDYCGRLVEYFQELKIQNLKTNEEEIIFSRLCCGNCKDRTEQ